MKFKELPIINWFYPVEKEQYPPRFINIVLNNVAKTKGIKDDFNKLIQIIEYGQISREYQYSQELLDAILKVDQMPLYEEKYNADEDFEFDNFETIGVSKYYGKK